MPKPRVLTKCVANAYTGPDERIIEYVFPGTHAGSSGRLGGLIRFSLVNGQARVEVYRHDKEVEVVVSESQ